jgi:hypothetical protein
VRSKEELLVEELADLQEEAWARFRRDDDRRRSLRERVRRFLDAQHTLLAADRDLTTIALRALTHPEARVARRVLALHERTIGLLAEILQAGSLRRDVLVAAHTLFHVTLGARIPWANGLVSAEDCRRSIETGVDLIFEGLATHARDEAP